jgi:hypothetical protein
MMTRATKALIIVTTGIAILGCTSQHAQFVGMLPAGATSVTYSNSSKTDSGVAFHMVSAPNSYQYVDAVRRKLSASGYELCGKSAISKWTPRPTYPRNSAEYGYWINELYATKGHGKFFLIRVDAIPDMSGQTWRQAFTLATQSIASGHQNTSSIREFCD